ncbi:MAG: hypothetical protein HY553_13290 [Elusimicrobia bacterium]|nr:hypothetical protein [Elusimicrobiota bacterium]
MDRALFAKFLRETDLLVQPAKRLSTFGATRIRYHLVSAIDEKGDRTRLRQGLVVSEKPQILTPDALRERFEGFGEGAGEFERWLSEEYRDLLRALEYKFRNQDLVSRVLRDDPREVAERIRKELASGGTGDAVLLRCPDAAWSLALMRFTLEEVKRSFPVNVRDLERRGHFAAEGPAGARRRNEIEDMFARAAGDPALRAALGKKLRDYGLFEEYEDRFLALF